MAYVTVLPPNDMADVGRTSTTMPTCLAVIKLHDLFPDRTGEGAI
jgi:hypothetical protein